MNHANTKLRPWIVLIVILPVLAYFLLMNTDWALFAEVALLLVAVPLMILDEERGLLALLFVRPMMDIFSDRTVTFFDRYTVNIAALLSLLVIIWALATLVRRRVRVWHMPLFWPLVLLLLVGIAGFAGTDSTSATLTEVVRIAGIILVYLLAATLITTPESQTRLRTVLLWSLTVPVLLGVYQAVTKTGLQFGDIGNRIYGTFAHPNSLAFYLVVMMTVALGWMLLRPKGKRAPLITLQLLLGALLIMTYTRSAWIGLAIVLTIVGFMRFRKALLIGGAVAVLIVALYPMANRLLFNVANIDLNQTALVRRILDKTDDSSFAFRTELWRDMAPKALERPALGHGLGTFTILRERQIITFFQGTEAHNDYLRLAVETGFVGFAAFLLLLVALFRRLLRSYQSVRSTPEGSMALAVLGLFGAYLVMSFFDNLLQTTAVQWALWSVFAAVIMMPDKKSYETSKKR